MLRIKPTEYRARHGLGDDDPLPEVELSPEVPEIRQELEYRDETCFVRTAVLFLREEITVEEYFDRLIRHLEAGSERHRFDKRKLTNMDALFKVDLISGAVKSWMFNRAFQRLDATDATKLKRLCVITYRSERVEDLRREAAAGDTPLASLPPRWHDILAVIAYARCHTAVLEHLVTYPAPSRSTFDLLPSFGTQQWHCGEWRIEERAQYMLLDIKLWTVLLEAEGGWVHFPMTQERYDRLCLLLEFWREPQLREVPEVERLCRVFVDLDLVLSAHGVARFLSIISGQTGGFPTGIKPCSLSRATMILSCFPISRITAGNKAKRLDKCQSADLMMPLTQWPLDNPGRLVVMRSLLEQGCDPNDKLSFSEWSQWLNPQQRHTTLYLARKRKDSAMVDLLLEFGALDDETVDSEEDSSPVQAKKRSRDPAANMPEEQRKKLRRLLQDSGIDAEPEGMDFFG